MEAKESGSDFAMSYQGGNQEIDSYRRNSGNDSQRSLLNMNNKRSSVADLKKKQLPETKPRKGNRANLPPLPIHKIKSKFAPQEPQAPKYKELEMATQEKDSARSSYQSFRSETPTQKEERI